MRLVDRKGAACLIRNLIPAFTIVLSFAGLADAAPAKAKKHLARPPATAVSSWEPEYAAAAVPSIWTGIYAGLSGGYAWGRSELQFGRIDRDFSARNPSGALGALTIGYNWELGGGWIGGVEGDIGLMDARSSDRAATSRIGPWWGTIRARAGYAFGETLVYATGGAAFAEFDETVAGGAVVTSHDTRSGWVAGGGVEHAIAANITAKVEYLHMDFGSFNAVNQNGQAFAFENHADLVRAGINYKF